MKRTMDDTTKQKLKARWLEVTGAMVLLWNDESLIPAKYKDSDQLNIRFEDSKELTAMLNETEEVPCLWAGGTFMVIPLTPDELARSHERSDNEVWLPEQDGITIVVVMT